MGSDEEQIDREGVSFRSNRQWEEPSGVVGCAAAWKLEMGCVPDLGATGRPAVLDGYGWW